MQDEAGAGVGVPKAAHKGAGRGKVGHFGLLRREFKATIWIFGPK
jgi:hypothetical protein